MTSEAWTSAPCALSSGSIQREVKLPEVMLLDVLCYLCRKLSRDRGGHECARSAIMLVEVSLSLVYFSLPVWILLEVC